MANYFSYEGRLNRWPYFLRYIGVYVFYVLFIMFMSMFSVFIILVTGENETISSILLTFMTIFMLIVYLAGLVFLLMQSIKRLHDLDKSGWYLLIRLTGAIPLIGWFIVLCFELYLFLAEGTAGPNRFGPDPLGREAGRNYNAASLNSEVVDADYENVDENEKQ